MTVFRCTVVRLMDVASMHDRRWWALAVLCSSLLVITLDNTILNVALPALVRDLHASTSQLQWIVDGYTLVFAGLLLTAGSLGDRFGRKAALGIGLVVFAVGSLASALSQTATELALTRAFTGIGGALIMPSTLSLLTNIFTEPKERGRAIGVWAALAGGGGAIGPVLGGLLLKHFHWSAVFLVNIPFCVVALVAGRFLLPESRDDHAGRLDLTGAFLSVAGLVAVLWGVIEAPVKGWTEPSVLGAFAVGLGILGAFVAWELRSEHPMLDVHFFENPRFSAANAAVTMVFFAMYGSMFLMTQYLQTVLGYSALGAGVRLLPMSIVMITTATMAPRIVEHLGTKVVVGTGLVLAATGLVATSMVPVSNGYAHLIVAMSVLSFGMGLTMAPATESIMGSLPPSKAGVGSAMNDTTRQVGGALGVAIIGSVLSSVYRPGIGSKLTALGAPQAAIDIARDSVGGAVQAAARLPEPLRDAVTSAAKHEFVDGLQLALLAGAVVVVAAAAIVFAFLPARAGDVRELHAVEGPLDGIASLTFAGAEGLLEETAEDALEDASL
jgi:EmrB/QacA subfamily drug resistance transporter